MTEPHAAGPIWQRDLPYIDPLAAAAAFRGSVLALFDSGGDPRSPSAGHSYLGIDPFSILQARDGTSQVDGVIDPASPLDVLGGMLGRHRLAPDPAGFAFRGGVAGYIGYEAGAGLEAVPAMAADADAPPDVFMACYDLVIGFDRQRRLCRIHASGLPETGLQARATRATMRLDWAAARLATSSPMLVGLLPTLDWQPDWSRDGYEAKLQRVLAYIAAGDIFQANLTMRHVAARPAGLDAQTVYAALRRANPAPFATWLACGPHDLCCSSPERFLRLDADGFIETSPIKGTIARASDPAEDTLARTQLAASEKDRAENVMIVDVLRNDLGRVAATGSIAVPDLCKLASYATLHHLVSRVTARLRNGLGPVDLLRAALPGGSITGAPKIRAMQIIAELEAARRGIYCGTATWIGYDGAMDSNIVIRSLVLTPNHVVAQAGGGIVTDSDPASEYAEMMLKLAPMLSIFGDRA